MITNRRALSLAGASLEVLCDALCDALYDALRIDAVSGALVVEPLPLAPAVVEPPAPAAKGTRATTTRPRCPRSRPTRLVDIDDWHNDLSGSTDVLRDLFSVVADSHAAGGRPTLVLFTEGVDVDRRRLLVSMYEVVGDGGDDDAPDGGAAAALLLEGFEPARLHAAHRGGRVSGCRLWAAARRDAR